MPDVTSHETLSGPEKAAVLLLALSEEQTARILAALEIEEVKELSWKMSALGSVDSRVVEKVLEEFGQLLNAVGTVSGGPSATERLLARFLDKDRLEEIMDGLRGPAGRTVWEKLGNINEAVLASYLRNEYPQTIAVVLSRLEPAHAARVLSNLPEDVASETILRMLRLDAVQQEVLADVERTLRAEFMGNLARGQRSDTHEVMAEIFNHFDRATESRLMAGLEERDKEAADRIKTLMFTFDDLARLDGAGVQLLLRNAGNDRIAVALKGASEKMRNLFFSNMSERAAKILRDDMQAMGPVRLRDVEEAQQFLVNMAKELAAAGEVFLADGKDDQLVY